MAPSSVLVDADVHDLAEALIQGHGHGTRPSKQFFLNNILRAALRRRARRLRLCVDNSAGPAEAGAGDVALFVVPAGRRGSGAAPAPRLPGPGGNTS